ncbi:MAG: nitrophenyl compound nitroreductase subunit ArsF family protein [Planctomycetaceae bacterium]|nr:nitrophenyl compound nitroreductase subunit ArsF family protein [Planctomycetaceae bacterium]
MLTVFLLTFVSVTFALQIAKEFRAVEPLRLADGLNIVCTHATVRCPPCLAMIRLVNEVLEESYRDAVAAGQIVFRAVNYEQPESADFAYRFKIATAAVVLVKVQDGNIVAEKNLITEARNLYSDESAFKQMLREQIDAM